MHDTTQSPAMASYITARPGRVTGNLPTGSPVPDTTDIAIHWNSADAKRVGELRARRNELVTASEQLSAAIGELEQREAELTTGIRKTLFEFGNTKKQRSDRQKLQIEIAELREELEIRAIQIGQLDGDIATAERDATRNVYAAMRRAEQEAARDLDRVFDEVLAPALARYYSAGLVAHNVGRACGAEGGNQLYARWRTVALRIKTILAGVSNWRPLHLFHRRSFPIANVSMITSIAEFIGPLNDPPDSTEDNVEWGTN